MVYKIHRNLESFLTFYYEHTKSGKIIVQKTETKKLIGSKGGKAVKIVKKQIIKKNNNYNLDNYGIDTIF